MNASFFSADKITGSLSDLAKRVPPGAIASVPGVRKAMGVAIEPPVRPVESIERTETSPAVDSSPAQVRGEIFPSFSNKIYYQIKFFAHAL